MPNVTCTSCNECTAQIVAIPQSHFEPAYFIIFMNNSTLVNNTDRIYGEQDPLRSVKANEYVDTQPEFSIWAKVIGLICVTYGLIAGCYALSYAIIKNKGGVDSFITGGGIMLAIFIVYGICWAFAWYKGSSKREEMKREAVEAELKRQSDAEGVL